MALNEKRVVFSPCIPYHFKIWVANPMCDIHLRTGEVIVDANNIVPHEHQAIHQMRSNKAGALQKFSKINISSA